MNEKLLSSQEAAEYLRIGVADLWSLAKGGQVSAIWDNQNNARYTYAALNAYLSKQNEERMKRLKEQYEREKATAEKAGLPAPEMPGELARYLEDKANAERKKAPKKPKPKTQNPFDAVYISERTGQTVAMTPTQGTRKKATLPASLVAVFNRFRRK